MGVPPTDVGGRGGRAYGRRGTIHDSSSTHAGPLQTSDIAALRALDAPRNSPIDHVAQESEIRYQDKWAAAQMIDDIRAASVGETSRPKSSDKAG
jgi:hypothetical protein